jgi:hypothetical protein
VTVTVVEIFTMGLGIVVYVHRGNMDTNRLVRAAKEAAVDHPTLLTVAVSHLDGTCPVEQMEWFVAKLGDAEDVRLQGQDASEAMGRLGYLGAPWRGSVVPLSSPETGRGRPRRKQIAE